MKRNVAVLCLFLTGALVALAQSAIKLTHSEALAAVASKVAPEYPPMARQLKIQGIVDLEAVVGENGEVEAVNTVSGNPILTKPASEALRKWKFTQQMQDGKPVRFVAPIVFTFKL